MKAIINVDRYDYHTFAPNCYGLYGGKSKRGSHGVLVP